MWKTTYIQLFFMLSVAGFQTSFAQVSQNDTIRLGVISVRGNDYPMIFLDDYVITENYMDPKERAKLNRLRNDIYVTYPYALAAAAVLKDIHAHLDTLPDRRSRKAYLKSIDKELDNTFKTPLKDLTIDQGHVLIKLIDRQTGETCYDIIKEVKGRLAAVEWESVGVFFKNNLTRDYDPEDRDRDIERIVSDLEASNYYHYQLQQQAELMKRIGKR